jgi:hypothetical protein
LYNNLIIFIFAGRPKIHHLDKTSLRTGLVPDSLRVLSSEIFFRFEVITLLKNAEPT